MTCSGCFARAKQRLGLDERIFRCWACGHTACRDRNAAGVVLVVAERGHIGVDDVSQVDHLPSGGDAVVVRAGNLLLSGISCYSGGRDVETGPPRAGDRGLFIVHAGYGRNNPRLSGTFAVRRTLMGRTQQKETSRADHR
ncbi:transposase [Rhodococcus zopfii]|nr:transposase [Rhodococcus zopfii]